MAEICRAEFKKGKSYAKQELQKSVRECPSVFAEYQAVHV